MLYKDYLFVEKMEDEGREQWVDVAKALAIICIVWGHCSSGFIRSFCYSFNSIVFFILSGYTFCKNRDKKCNQFLFEFRSILRVVVDIFTSLVIPYLIWGSISIVIYSVLIEKELPFINSVICNFGGLLYGNSETEWFSYYRPLWFIPCLICVELIWWTLLKLGRRKIVYTYWGIMLVSMVWTIVYYVFNFHFVWPWEMETVFVMLFFFGIGIGLRNDNLFRVFSRLIKSSRLNILYIFMIMTLLAILVLLNGGTDTRTNYFGNLVLYICGGGLGFYLCFYLGHVLKDYRILNYIGRRTMSILVMHKYPILFAELIFFKGENNSKILSVVISFIIMCFTMVMCLVAERIISKRLKWIFGFRLKRGGDI